MKNKHSDIRVSVAVLGNLVLALFVCLVVAVSLAVIGSNFIGLLITQLILYTVLGPLVYIPCWVEGDSDKNAVNFGRKTEEKYRGIKIGLMAAVPFFLTSILLVLSKLSVIPDLTIIYKLANAFNFVLINVISPSGYITDISWLTIFFLTLTPLVIPAFAEWGYLNGYHRFSIADKVLYKNKKKKTTK